MSSSSTLSFRAAHMARSSFLEFDEDEDEEMLDVDIGSSMSSGRDW